MSCLDSTLLKYSFLCFLKLCSKQVSGFNRLQNRFFIIIDMTLINHTPRNSRGEFMIPLSHGGSV
jgi:hypothetical protein